MKTVEKRKIKIAFFVFSGTLGLVLTIDARSNTPVSDQYRSISVLFDNGDKGEIVCNALRNGCSIKVSVYGKNYSFAGDEIKSVSPLVADSMEIVRFRQAPDEFGIGLHYWCPREALEKYPYLRCHADVLVRDGKIDSIQTLASSRRRSG